MAHVVPRSRLLELMKVRKSSDTLSDIASHCNLASNLGVRLC
jgi:hypothetical protein